MAIAVAGANRHDKTLVDATMRNIQVDPPAVPRGRHFYLAADRGYDSADVREFVAEWGFTPNIARRALGEVVEADRPRYRSRRWVVERTHSWMNRFRRLLIRWEKKVVNYVAFLHLACAIITLRAARVLG